MIENSAFQILEVQASAPQQAFEAIYEFYSPIVYGAILKACNYDKQLAENLTYNVFITTFKNLPNYSLDKGSFLVFIFRIVVIETTQHGLYFNIHTILPPRAKIQTM